jgi:hypothetical protein
MAVTYGHEVDNRSATSSLEVGISFIHRYKTFSQRSHATMLCIPTRSDKEKGYHPFHLTDKRNPKHGNSDVNLQPLGPPRLAYSVALEDNVHFVDVIGVFGGGGGGIVVGHGR